MRRLLTGLATAALALTAGAAVVSAVLLVFATILFYDAAQVLLDITARSLEESP